MITLKAKEKTKKPVDTQVTVNSVNTDTFRAFSFRYRKLNFKKLFKINTKER